MNLITESTITAGGELFVIMDEEKSTVLKGPGDVPFNTTERKIAEKVAKEISKKIGQHLFVVPLREAIKLVMANPKNW